MKKKQSGTKHKGQWHKSKTQLSPQKPKKEFFQKVYNVMGGISLFLNLLLMYFAFLPQIDVSSYNPSSFSDLLQIVFKIENKSILPLYDFYILVHQSDIETAKHIFTNNATRTDYLCHYLGAGTSTDYSYQHISIEINDTTTDKIINGSVEVWVSYELPILPIRMKEKFKFYPIIDTNGKTNWIRDNN